MASPPYLEPFVLAVPEAQRRREGSMDVYWPAEAGTEPLPLIVFVHGGPVPADLQPTPRDWPVYRGYGALAASQRAAGITVDHRLHSPEAYQQAASDVSAAVGAARALPGADPDRVALWFFSGGGLLSACWLAGPPPWLRCLALTYPVLAPLPGRDIDPAFRPAAALSSAGGLPVLLTRVGRERPAIAETVAAFSTEAERLQARLTVIDVPDGQHGFDMLDHTEESRAAVTRAMAWVIASLQR